MTNFLPVECHNCNDMVDIAIVEIEYLHNGMAIECPACDKEIIFSFGANICTCKAIETLAEDYGLPFERPLQIDKENHGLKLGDWCIRMFYTTPSGNVSKKHGPAAVVKFCPFCGGRMSSEE